MTGSTSGIEEAIVKLFAKDGATVIVVGRNVSKGKKLQDEMNSEDIMPSSPDVM